MTDTSADQTSPSHPPNRRGSYVRAKRLLDVIIAVTGLVATAPVWVATGAGIRLLSPGPILYRGRRMGVGGRVFDMFKFRSMTVDAESQGPGITSSTDARVTPFGRLLRRWKLDELPQLLNVLMGDMSIVGPRPEDPRYLEEYTEEQREVLTVPPGITGPAQIAYRHEERMLDPTNTDLDYRGRLLPAKLALDLEYVRNRSLGSDLRLIAATIKCLGR